MEDSSILSFPVSESIRNQFWMDMENLKEKTEKRDGTTVF
jgi:hypothetical protein